MPPRPPSVQSDSIMHSSVNQSAMGQDRGECGRMRQEVPGSVACIAGIYATTSAAFRWDCLHLDALLCPVNTPQAGSLNNNVPGQASRQTLYCCVFVEKQRPRFFRHCVYTLIWWGSLPVQCTCVTLRCLHTGLLGNLLPPYLHASLREARCMGWATIPRTTPWETMGLREASLAHKVRPKGRRCMWCLFCFVFFKSQYYKNIRGKRRGQWAAVCSALSYHTGVFLFCFFWNPKNIMNEFTAVVLRPSQLRR